LLDILKANRFRQNQGAAVMLNGTLGRFNYGITLLRTGGIKTFFKHLRSVFYYSEVLLGLEMRFDKDKIDDLPAALPFYMKLASKDDIEEILRKAQEESPESVYELIHRKLFYESGFARWYVGKVVGTDDICYMQWLVRPHDEITKSKTFKGRYTELKENEFLLENAYTFEKYRGKGIGAAAMLKLTRIASDEERQNTGRMITYVNKDNRSSLRMCEKIGFKVFEERQDRQIFLILRRKLIKANR